MPPTDQMIDNLFLSRAETLEPEGLSQYARFRRHRP
jgi:hypothetical protein